MTQDEEKVCPICSTECSIRFSHDRSSNGRPTLKKIVECPKCGKFLMDNLFELAARDDSRLGHRSSRARASLSSFIRERQREDGSLLRFENSFFQPETRDLLRDEFVNLPAMSFHQRADRLLKAIEEETTFAGDVVDLREKGPAWIARAWALNGQEFEEILTYLLDQTNRLRDREDLTAYQKDGSRSWHKIPRTIVQIRPEGWEHLEKLEENPNSAQGFVAMWFNSKMDSLWEEGIRPAISKAGFTPVRIDLKPGEERIDHRIEVEIRNSRFIVADMTGHRGGVYFEAGFARALGRPVFFTCHKDDFDELHFDTRQFTCLMWNDDSLDKLAEGLRYSIENVCGRGPNPAP